MNRVLSVLIGISMFIKTVFDFRDINVFVAGGTCRCCRCCCKK